MKVWTGILVGLNALWLCTAQAQTPDPDFGVLVMAHGGQPAWDAGVLETVAPLREKYNLEVAFGMADAVSLQKAVSALEDRGAEHIAVVRLFISGESWYDRTREILGMTPGAPARPVVTPADHSAHGAHSGHAAAPAAMGGHSMEYWLVDSDAGFSISKDGLADVEEMGAILLTRAETLSVDPAKEDVLILAHGPEDDAENERWLQAIDQRAELVREGLPFHEVRVMSLREDWEDKREAAEREVRAFVSKAQEEGRRAIVIPYRVHGFGPYEEVLEGLDYAADGAGLIPHPAVSRWIVEQAEELRP